MPRRCAPRAPPVAGPGIHARASRGRAPPKARPARGRPHPNASLPLGASSPRRCAAVHSHAPRTGGPSAVSPPYARCPSRRSTAGIFAVIRRHPRTPQTTYKSSSSLPSAPPRAAPPPLPPPPRARAPTRARCRPVAPVASLGSSITHALACCPAFCLLTALSRAAAATAVGRRRTRSPTAPPPQHRSPTAPRWASGHARPLARPAAPPAHRSWPRPRRPPRPRAKLLRLRFVYGVLCKSRDLVVEKPI
jgi:hypothetical protein